MSDYLQGVTFDGRRDHAAVDSSSKRAICGTRLWSTGPLAFDPGDYLSCRRCVRMVAIKRLEEVDPG